MSKRLQKIRDKWDNTKLQGLKGIFSEIKPETIFNAVVSADPTPNHKYVDWCLNAWARGSFQWEDIRGGGDSIVADQLLRFETNKHRITDPAMRSLLKYKGPGELDVAMNDAGVALQPGFFDVSSNQQKKDMMIKARLESIHYERASGLKFDSPLTEFASNILGRNTRWCTAASNNNMFSSYIEDGPLIIITLPNGKRFQAHCALHDFLDCKELNEAIERYESYTSSKTKDYKKILGSATIDNRIVILNEEDIELSNEELEEIAPYKSEIVDYLAETYSRLFHPYIQMETEYVEFEQAYYDVVHDILEKKLSKRNALEKDKNVTDEMSRQKTLDFLKDKYENLKEIIKVFADKYGDIIELKDCDYLKGDVSSLYSHYSPFEFPIKFRDGTVDFNEAILKLKEGLMTDEFSLLRFNLSVEVDERQAMSLISNINLDYIDYDIDGEILRSIMKGIVFECDDKLLIDILSTLESRDNNTVHDNTLDKKSYGSNMLALNIMQKLSPHGLSLLKDKDTCFNSLIIDIAPSMAPQFNSLEQLVRIIAPNKETVTLYTTLQRVISFYSREARHLLESKESLPYMEKVYREYVEQKHIKDDLNSECLDYLVRSNIFHSRSEEEFKTILESKYNRHDFLYNAISLISDKTKSNALRQLALDDLDTLLNANYKIPKKVISLLSEEQKYDLFAMGFNTVGYRPEGLPVAGEYKVEPAFSFDYREAESLAQK